MHGIQSPILASSFPSRYDISRFSPPMYTYTLTISLVLRARDGYSSSFVWDPILSAYYQQGSDRHRTQENIWIGGCSLSSASRHQPYFSDSLEECCYSIILLSYSEIKILADGRCVLMSSFYLEELLLQPTSRITNHHVNITLWMTIILCKRKKNYLETQLANGVSGM